MLRTFRNTETARFMALLQKSMIVALILLAATCFIYILYLDSYYHLNGAREPQPEEGRIYPETVHHGTHIFLTEREKFNFEVWLPSISIGSFLVAGLVNMRWKQFVVPVYENPRWAKNSPVLFSP